MQWDPQAVRAALAAPGEKTSRRLLSELCEDFRREKPEEWKRIEAASYSEPDCAAAQRPFRSIWNVQRMMEYVSRSATL